MVSLLQSPRCTFLAGVFEENARLLQSLVFFRQFNAIGPLFLLTLRSFRLSEGERRVRVSH